MSNKSGGSVSRNFRFDNASARWLQFESERKGVSLNSLVNNIFRKYSEFDRLAERTEMVTLSQYLLAMLIESVPDAELADKVFHFGKKMGHDSVLFWKKKVNVETLRDYLSSTMCEYCNLAEYDVDVDTDTLILTHNLGPKGTIFLTAYIDGLIMGSMGTRVHIQSNFSTITFSFKSLGQPPLAVSPPLEKRQ